MLLEIARLPAVPSWVMTPLAAFIVRLPRISVLPLVPVTLKLLVFTAKSELTSIVPVTSTSATIATVAWLPVLVSRMMSVSPLMPIKSSVNLTDSTST